MDEPRRASDGTPTAGRWHLITGEYPPAPGGVADYTAAVAAAMADRGAEVHVWTPGDADGLAEGEGGVAIHRLAGRFGPAGLARLDRELGRFAGPRRLLIQYTPHAFGLRAMNLPFAAWAAWRARRGDDVRVMFHEVAFPWVRRPLRHNLLAAVHRLMASVLAGSCTRAHVSTQGWEPLLRRLCGKGLDISWTPVPSNVPGEASPAAVAARRAMLTVGDPAARVIGHFGTYPPSLARDLAPALRDLLGRRPEIRVLLLGSAGERWRAEFLGGQMEWSARVTAPGPLPAAAISESLRACDLALQPFPDGASGRRTSLMAALANGVPAVTNLGFLSESLWGEGGVAAAPDGDPARLSRLVLDLLDHPQRLGELGRAGRRLYEERFAVRHTVALQMGPA
ncbi:glycosyltransferase family 4 protein (plasmid) [Tundrisphaera sp. TA3]|uniref:glycosyltransferase family 4 protein n=1 Tax=Tundrisphaera sp. TA3 TaxID=3435775 RepID=UPI003EBCC059